MLVVDDALIDRILRVEIDNLRSRLEPYERRDKNPMGVIIRSFGRATAFIAQGIPDRFFNSVLGVGPELVDDLDELLEHYDAHRVSPAFEIVPGRLTEALGHTLANRGFRMVEFHAGLALHLGAQVVSNAHRLPAKIDVIDPEQPKALELFLDTYLEGWSGSGDHESAKQNMREWRANPSWRFYLARVDGEAAGAAILDVRGDTAILGSASTRAAFRGRGVQRALLDRRITDSASSGCDLLVGGAYAGTISMRNQQRAGLQTAFTRGIWVRGLADKSRRAIGE